MLKAAVLLIMLAWFFGFGLLRVLAIRAAVRAGRGEFGELWFSFGWRFERGSSWAPLNWAAILWLASLPLILVGWALLS
jgi:hypothetical protein